jgi:N-acylglucosamine 2-epimerase
MIEMTLQSAAGRRELAEYYRNGLLNDVLPFWLKHAVDDELGGIMCSIDQDGTLIDTDKGIWQQGRFTWLLGKLYNNIDGDKTWLSIAKKSLSFLDQFGFDPEDGRMWFHVTREGRPLRKRRYAYSESFAAIAYGEIAKATGDAELAEKAQKCFRRFIDHNLRPKNVTPKFTDARPTRSIGFPMITINTAQELRESIGLSDANQWIDRAIQDIQQHFVKPEIECVMECVGASGELLPHFDGRTLNPGHAIEGAWFIMREGMTRNDRSLIDLGCRMLEWMWKRGWDPVHGGLLYFVGVDGKPVQEYWHDMKFWWPHNETIIATLLAYLLTGEDRYASWHREVHDWSARHFAAPEHGEWFGYLRRDGTVSSTLKGNLWKGPFHLPRMQLVCWQLLEKAEAAGVPLNDIRPAIP